MINKIINYFKPIIWFKKIFYVFNQFTTTELINNNQI